MRKIVEMRKDCRDAKTAEDVKAGTARVLLVREYVHFKEQGGDAYIQERPSLSLLGKNHRRR